MTTYATPNGLLKAATELGIGTDRFRQVSPGRWKQLLDDILAKFTRGGVRNHSRLWLWEDFVDPTFAVQDSEALPVVLRMDDPSARVWLVVEDIERTKQVGNFWIFEGDLAAVVGVLGNYHALEYYVVGQTLDWLVAENHHNMLIGVGTQAVQRLKMLCET